MIDLDAAIRYSKEIIVSSSVFDKVTFSMYSKVFFSATENIKGYLDNFDFNRNRALTVLSGGDHVFNLIHAGVEKIDAFDINRLTYFVYHLRKAMIKSLSLEEYINYNYFFTCAYTDELILIVKTLRKMMPEDVYEYYRQMLEFCYDNDFPIAMLYYGPRIVFKKINSYLASEDDYRKLQAKISEVEVNLHFLDAKEVPKIVKGPYDIILLSNISDYFGTKVVPAGLEEFETYVKSYERLLDRDGILINYLYFLNSPYVIKDSTITKNDLGEDNIFSFKGANMSGEGYYRVRKRG